MRTPSILFFSFVIFSTGLRAQGFEGRDFRKADSVATLYPGHSLRDLKCLADKLTLPLATNEEKFRAIYVWVCLNIESDFLLFLKNKRHRNRLRNDAGALNEWNRKFSVMVFHKLLTDHKTICTGYAYLIKALATSAGFSCVIVDGYGRSVQSNIGGSGVANHSWNGIRLNNQWYLCDATWSCGAIDGQTGKFVRHFNPSYFLADPSLFIRNHYPLDTAWILLAYKPSLQEFLNRPLIYTSLYKYKITPIFPESFEVAAVVGKPVSFSFRKDSDAIVERVELQVLDPNADHISRAICSNGDGIYCIDHLFTEKGIHVIHVLMDSNYVLTYSVNVR